MARKPIHIDHDKLRAETHALGSEYAFYMLDDAIELLPPAKLFTAEAREAMDILFGLLNHIDECLDDVIFFADEGGSWQVGVDWAKVLAVWFKELSATAEPEEYAKRIKDLLSRRYSYGRDKMPAIARRTATSDQRKALAEAKGA